VVLQRFRGELTILDSRGGGSSEYGDEEQGQISRGGDFGRSSPSQDRRPAPSFGGGSGGGGGGGGSRYNDLDDDIPF